MDRIFDYPEKIFDPQGPFLQKWNKICVLCCLLAVSLDPLFFYIPVIDGEHNCLDLDKKLETTACVLRSFFDILYVLHMLFQFRIGFIDPSSRVFGQPILVQIPWIIAKRYLSFYFIIDILSVLPIPQVLLLCFKVIPKDKALTAFGTMETLTYIILIQYVPGFIRIYPLFKVVTRSSVIFPETVFAGIVANLTLFVLASHVVGSISYFYSIERQHSCWRMACKMPDCYSRDLYCDIKKTRVTTIFSRSCPLVEPNDIQNSLAFNFGIFLEVLQSGATETRDFSRKFLYCLWWGLRNLSSLGQNLKTSIFIWEIIFTIFIALSGLTLFAFLIGNMQKYMQLTIVGIEQRTLKRRDVEQWMSRSMLPENLRERIRRYEQLKWKETRGFDQEFLLQSFPKDLRRDIRRHFCLHLLKRVPFFAEMDETLLDAMCERLKPVLYPERSYIQREWDPVDEMLFIKEGRLSSTAANGGKTSSEYLKAGDFCGEELLRWALDPKSSNLPSSTRTVQALKEVEAFALTADDLKFVASQFRYLLSKQIHHTFRFYSNQWRTWAACFIQAAWRRFCGRKRLSKEEDILRNPLAKETETSPSLSYASRFADNALKALRPRSTARVSPSLPQKPDEPDFTSKDR